MIQMLFAWLIGDYSLIVSSRYLSVSSISISMNRKFFLLLSNSQPFIPPAALTRKRTAVPYGFSCMRLITLGPSLKVIEISD